MRRPLCLVCLMFVMLMLLIMEIFPYKYEFPEDINGETVLISGKVSKKETKTTGGQASYFIYLEQIVPQPDSHTGNYHSGKDSILSKLNNVEGILCYMSNESYIPNIGSYVKLQGKVYTFSIPSNPGEFNEALYYQIKGLDIKMYDCNLVAYSEDYFSLGENLFRLKQFFCESLDTCFRKEYSGIAKAILFAMNGELDKEIKSLYQRNGVLHILCVSGTHITILGMGLYKLLKRFRLSEIPNAVICISLMVLYGVMIGMGTSVFRAILMFSLRIISRLLGRTYDLLTAASLGVFCILLEQPLYMYHSGFLLSFLSVIALGTFTPIFPQKVCKIKGINTIAKNFFSTCIVWLFTLPIYGLHYYEVSLSGLILNVIILPFVSVVLVLVMLVCFWGSFCVPIAKIFAYGCEMILCGFEKLFEVFDAIGNTTLVLGRISNFRCILYYLGFIGLLLLVEKIKKRYIYLGIILLCAFLLIRLPKQLEITCLDVGQGDCIVVEYKDVVCVIDVGSSSENDVGTYTLLPFLKYQGIREIDYLFLTHSDSDHTNGVEAVLVQNKTGIDVKKVVITDGEKKEDYDGIIEVARLQGISVCEMKAGNFVWKEELYLEALSPSEQLLEDVKESGNETSLVLLLNYRDFQMLFTGDVEKRGEELVTEYLKDKNCSGVTVLKVAHHGSKNSTSQEFLEVANPKISIISCGENNNYGHPHIETLERLENIESTVFMTKDSGAITVKVGKTIRVYGYRE